MNKNNLKQKLLAELGEDYEIYIEKVLDIITIVTPENYFLYESLVKNLKEKAEIEQRIKDEKIPKYISTDRKGSIKVNPMHRELERITKEVIRLSKTISKKTKKQQEEEKELMFDPTDEEDCAIFMLLWFFRFIPTTKKDYDDLNVRKNDSLYPQIIRNPLYNERLSFDEQSQIVHDILDKYHEAEKD